MAFANSRWLKRVAFLFATAATLISCDGGPKQPGSIRISYTTDQGDESLFVWGVSVDGASPHTVNSSDKGSFILDAVAAGDHHLILSSLPPRCTSGEDNRAVSVASKDTLSVTFAVKCTRTTGDIALTVATSGADFDPDGYRINIDGSVGPAIAA